MSRRPKSITWDASDHTIAKIRLVQSYVYVWASILGRARRAEPIVYVDGFAGPGQYNNFNNSSPIAAIKSLAEARKSLGNAWIASNAECYFVEEDKKRADHLSGLVEDLIEPMGALESPKTAIIQETFETAYLQLVARSPQAFTGTAPLFAFLDPFGATGVSFETVSKLLQYARTEVLINFDADGVARILRSGEDSKAGPLLDEVFGSTDWQQSIDKNANTRKQGFQALELYKQRLRSIDRVEYVFSFEMKSTAGSTNYFLVFASQHFLGLEKMKECMSTIDKSGEYTFCDAAVGQGRLFKFDEPADSLPAVLHEFSGRTVEFEEVFKFVLNYTPLRSAKKVLQLAEKAGDLSVETNNESRRAGTFPDEFKYHLTFKDQSHA